MSAGGWPFGTPLPAHGSNRISVTLKLPWESCLEGLPAAVRRDLTRLFPLLHHHLPAFRPTAGAYNVLMYAAIGSMDVYALVSFLVDQHARLPRDEWRFRVPKSVCIFLNASFQTRLKTFSSTWRRAWTKAARTTGSSRCGNQTLLLRKFSWGSRSVQQWEIGLHVSTKSMT
jgi:hypothetical protein